MGVLLVLFCFGDDRDPYQAKDLILIDEYKGKDLNLIQSIKCRINPYMSGIVLSCPIDVTY